MMESRIHRLATALMDAMTDEDRDVQEQIQNSLSALGDADAEETLRCCGEFLRQRHTLPLPVRARILRSMESVIRNHLPDLSEASAGAAVLLASQEMTKSKEHIPEWQEAAGDVLVEIGKRFLTKVMEEMLGKLQPGILPQPCVLRTLGNLALANVLGVVPFLNSILGTLLPVLSLVRSDSMKCSFCYALQRFSESVLEFLAAREQNPEAAIRRDAFAHEMGTAFDALLGTWGQSRDIQVRLAVLGALGPMSSLIPEEKLEEQIPKLLPAILSLSKKLPEPFPVSKSLCQILESSVAIGSRSLEAQLESILATLLSQICAPADPNVPTSAKNHTELLRCFSVLGSAFPERLLAWLRPKLEGGSERGRAGALLLLRQLLNSAPSQLEMKKFFIISSLRLPLQDSSTKVKISLVQLISALAQRGFLEQPGAEALLEFLVRQCCLQDGSPGIPAASPGSPRIDDVRSGSASALVLLGGSAAPGAARVLWPLLLPFLIPGEFSAALTPLCRSLNFLARKIREEEPENEAWSSSEQRGNFPSPQAVTARLLTVSSRPFLGCGRGVAALTLLGALPPRPQLENMWDKEIPKLLAQLEENTENSLCQREWEEKLLQFLRESLDSIPEKSWICLLVSEISRQLRDPDGSREEKSFLYRCLGTALGSCPSRDLVRKQLQEILENARGPDEDEREGLGWCFGICARSHLQETLEKLEEFEKSDAFRKSQGIFSIFRERGEGDAEQLRSGLVLCYGRVAEAAPAPLLRSRLESQILSKLLQHGRTKVLGIKVETKDPALKLSLARSISMISRALARGNSGDSGNVPGNGSGNCPGNCPGNGPGGSVTITHKAELVALMVEFLGAEPPAAPRARLRQRALSTCSHLLSLDPPLDDSERRELLEAALGSVLPLPPPKIPHQAQDLCEEELGSLRELLQGLLRRRLSPHGLQEIFAHLGPWIQSPRQPERRRALGLSKSLLEFFLHNLHVTSVTPFYNLSWLLALLAPRCCDGIPEMRADSVDCVRDLLRIQRCYQGFSRDHRDELLEGLESLKQGLENPDFSVLFHTCTRLAEVLGRRVPPDQLLDLLLDLFRSWQDPDGNCSRGAAVICNSLLREKGNILREKVPELLSVIHSTLQSLQEEQLRRAAQQSLRILGMQHPQNVVESLLGNPLPYDRHSCAMWRALGTEPSLNSQILELLLEKLSREIPFKENKSFLPGGAAEREATAASLAATCALGELMSVPEAAAALLERFPELFLRLLLRLGGSVGVRLPKSLRDSRGEKRGAARGWGPCSCAVETLQTMLTRAGHDDVVRDVENSGGWELMEIPERHHDGIALLAGAMARLCGPRLPPIVRSLIPELGSVFECQRVTSTAFLAELLRHQVVSDLLLLEPLLEALAALEKDSCLLVRVLALRGLGNLASGSPEQLCRLAAPLLSSLLSGLDDQDDPDNRLALESMSSLSRLLERLEAPDARPALLRVAIRIRPFFDSEHPDLRRSSIELFGNLSRLGGGDSEVFSEQILGALVTLLLHLQDPQPDVVKACKFSLRMCGPGLGCAELREMFGNLLGNERGLHYGEFINHVCKLLLRSRPSLLSRLLSTNLFYFKSPWRELRAAAAMFTGFLVLHMDEEQRPQLDLDELISALKLLLKDPVPAVRIKVAETLGRLVRLL